MFSCAQLQDREYWIRWLQKYKTLKCLWDTDERKQKSKKDVNAAYQELANFSKEIYPNADINYVRYKINSFRACYRRECRKIQAAKDNGTEYTPTLFYFKYMKFLTPEEVFDEDSRSWKDESQEEGDDEDLEERDPFENITRNLDIKIPNNKKAYNKNSKWNKGVDNMDNNLDDLSCLQQCSKITVQGREDEFDIFGRRIAEHFRKMNVDQWLVAEKMISEVCVHGRLKSLSIQTRVNSATLHKPGQNKIKGKRSMKKRKKN